MVCFWINDELHEVSLTTSVYRGAQCENCGDDALEVVRGPTTIYLQCWECGTKYLC